MKKTPGKFPGVEVSERREGRRWTWTPSLRHVKYVCFFYFPFGIDTCIMIFGPSRRKRKCPEITPRDPTVRLLHLHPKSGPSSRPSDPSPSTRCPVERAAQTRAADQAEEGASGQDRVSEEQVDTKAENPRIPRRETGVYCLAPRSVTRTRERPDRQIRRWHSEPYLPPYCVARNY